MPNEDFVNRYILALDPSNKATAYVLLNTSDMKPIDFGIIDNEEMLNKIKTISKEYAPIDIVIETIQSFGMAVGASVFETCILIGRFYQEAKHCSYNNIDLLYRSDEKMCICHSMKATDASIKCELKNLYGDVGTKKNKGFFYGVSKDVWSAFAVAHTYVQILNKKYLIK